MVMEIAGEEIQTLSLDHHGLVAAVCKDLRIAEKINSRMGKADERRVVSTGKAAVAMILNGLGFTNRRLYLTHQFFETRPTEILLDEQIKASDITDYTLGHALDEIAEYGASKLFGEVAFEVAIENDLLGALNHIDTTSVSVDGEYDTKTQGDEGEPSAIKMTYGHSKDYRPDLKQLVLSLVVNGPSSMPLFMESLSGNNSDKNSFHETIKKVEDFKKQINLEKNFKWVADSALYTPDKLLKHNDMLWLTRVPETIKEAKDLVRKPDCDIEWKELGKGYKIAQHTSHYGGIEQRWLLVFSEQAYEREKKTLEKNLGKKDAELKKILWHLGNEIFDCEIDAKSAFKKIEIKNNLHTIESKIVEVKKYAKKGKPKLGEEKILVGFKVESSFERNGEEINKISNKKGRFILATNDLDKENYLDQLMLSEYKEQQNVEGGFRFMKDPWFMLDSIFLKSPKRIEALMMVMTLCLMVYNIAQYKLRNQLKEKNETLPNQLNKQIKNPTVRWIFQIMEGIGVVEFYKKEIFGPVKKVVTNINALRKKIINLFGETACRMYGLIQKNTAEVLGM
jgi:transposase